MKPIYLLLAAALTLTACGGNPFVDATTDPVTPPTDPATDTVVVPDALKNNIQSVVYTPGATPAASTLQIAITGLDTTPVVATWARRPSLDTAGYTAFAVQEDALDRLFVGLAKSSADNSTRAVLASDGGQFNKFYSGTTYERTGAFDAPTATGSVSYAGRYVGMLNGGGSGSELITPPAGTDPTVLPGQSARVTGDVFINANFSDNTVGGTIYNRVVVDGGFGLESVVLVSTSILANGTFGDVTERSLIESGEQSVTGTHGGVFGGTDASSVAGAISLDSVYLASDHTVFDNALERGIYVLNQCGLAGVPVVAGCAGTAP